MKMNNLPTGEQKLKIKKIAKKFDLKLVLLFGSFSTGKSRMDSDLDIAVLGLREFSLQDEVKLVNELSDVFKKNVDLSVLNNANPLLLSQVSKNSILIFGSKEEFSKFKLYAFRLYNDYAPYFKMESALNKKIINTYVN